MPYAEPCAWRKDLTKDSLRQSKSIEQRRGPGIRRWIVKLCRGRVGKLVRLLTRQQPMKQIGDHQKGFGSVKQLGILPLHGEELKERIELHELEACLCEYLFATDNFKRSLHHVVRPFVSIVVRVSKQLVARS